jgi:hypothetical protein
MSKEIKGVKAAAISYTANNVRSLWYCLLPTMPKKMTGHRHGRRTQVDLSNIILQASQMVLRF